MKRKGKEKKPRVKLSKKSIKEWVQSYKLFMMLLSISLVAAGYTMWTNRPNYMRVPNFKNTIDYSLVEGVYNFDEFYDEFEAQHNASINNVHFKLSEDYCYELNNIKLCISGYELFETDKNVELVSTHKLDKTKYFMVVKVDVTNDREKAIELTDFDTTYNDVYDFAPSLRQDDLDIPNNIGGIRYDNGLVVEGGELYSGYMVYAFSPNYFRQLYFIGSTLTGFPTITDKSKIDSQDLFALRGTIEFPIVAAVEKDHLRSVKNLPMDYNTGYAGFTTSTDRAEPNATITNKDESLSLFIETIETGYFQYRPVYVAKRRGRSGYDTNVNYQSFKVNLTNNTSQTINTSEFMLSVDYSDSSYPRQANISSRSVNIGPGESYDMYFNTQSYDRVWKLDRNKTYRLILSNGNKEILIEGDFELE